MLPDVFFIFSLANKAALILPRSADVPFRQAQAYLLAFERASTSNRKPGKCCSYPTEEDERVRHRRLKNVLSLGRLRKDGLGIKPRHPAGGTGMVAKDAETSGRHCDPDGY